jgi:hypothetical protein
VGASSTQLVLRSVREMVASCGCFRHTAGGALGARDGGDLWGLGHTVGAALGAPPNDPNNPNNPTTPFTPLHPLCQMVVCCGCFGHTVGVALGAQDGDEL